MAKEKKAETTKKSSLALKVAGVVLLVLVLSFVGAFFAYSKEYKNKVLPNIFFMDKNLSGKSKEELRSQIKDMSEQYSKENIKLVYGDKSYEMKFSDIDWHLKTDEITDQVYRYGRSGGKVTDIFTLAYVGIRRISVEPQFAFNENQVVDWLYSINSEIGTAKKEANIQVKNKKAKIIEPSEGNEIDQTKLKEEIYKQLSLGKKSDIKVELVKSKPIISKEEAEALADKAVTLVSDELKLIAPKSEHTWSSNTLGNLIEVKKDEKKGGFLQPSSYSDAYISFSENKISSLLEDASADMNVDPVEARFTISNGEVTIQSPSKDGTVIDIPSASKKIAEVLKEGKEKTVKLPVKAQEASIQAKSPADIAKFGIKELLGTGVTTFNGSPANRVHNIKTGVQAISGALIKPGEEFSTTGHLGVIDASTGYLQEMVIKEDKTVPEFGGGLCQVSTTLFRAAMNSGLKITERKNHSYRVSYYEPPVGMDATIYSPSPDLKFVNDTSSYILVQGRVEGYKATFDFYGTKDGREIEISEPNVYDVVAPPDTIYIDDPSLAPGEEKRIDRAHPGAKASFTYKVKKDGVLINNQTFNSTYVAWPAKYLRGPAQEGNDQQTPQ